VRRDATAILRDIAADQGGEAKLEEAGVSEGTGRQLTRLVRKAFAKVRLLDGNLQDAEAELRAALHHEADLRAELALQEASRGTQTEADLPTEVCPEISQSTQTPEQWLPPQKEALPRGPADRLILAKSLRKLHGETAARKDSRSSPPSNHPQVRVQPLAPQTFLGPPVTQAKPTSAVPEVPREPLFVSHSAGAPNPPKNNGGAVAPLEPIALDDIRMASARPTLMPNQQLARERANAQAPQRLDLARRLRERAKASGVSA